MRRWWFRGRLNHAPAFHFPQALFKVQVRIGLHAQLDQLGEVGAFG
jgi:hypothetical protein